MRLPSISRLVLALLCCFAVAACGGGTLTTYRAEDGEVSQRRVHGAPAAALRRASNEIPCPVPELSVHDLGSGGYRVEGCGVAITYTCTHTLCSPNERTSAVSSAPTEDMRARSARTWSDADVRELLDRLRQPVGACLPESTDTTRVQVSISTRGRIRRVGQSRLDAAVAECIDRTFAAVVVPGSVPESRSVVLQFRRGDPGPQTQAVEAAPGPPPGFAAPPPDAHTPETAARAAIDSRAAAILACVEAEALSIQVSWSSDGRLDALLRGERQGTPDEGCVRALVQQLSIPAPRSPGTIVHAIQR